MPKIDYHELNSLSLLLQQARLDVLSDCEQYEHTLQSFSSDTSLSGKSWDNAKTHAEHVAPVAKGLANALAQTGEVFRNYLSSFQSEVGSPKNRLDTDKLQELNDRLKQTRNNKKAVLQQIEKLKNFPSNQIMGNSGSSYAISGFDSAIGTINKDIEILEKYRDFEAAHAKDFAEVLLAFDAVKTGLKAIANGDTFTSSSGYQVTNMAKETWMTTLTAYNKKQPKTHTEYVKRYQVVTDENGITKTYVVYEIYTNGEYDYLQSQKVAELMQEARMEKGKEFLLEVTSVNDFIRTFKGVDPITGEKLSSQERGFAALMSFLTVVSAATAIKMLKNARRGSKLMKEVDVAGEMAGIEKKVSGFDYLDDQLGSIKNNVKVNKYESAESVNDWWKKQGYNQPPYTPKTVAQEVTLLEDTKFVRVYDGVESGLYGGWVMRAEDVKGLTPLQIQEKFALPQLPDFIGEVTLPKGSTIRAGEVNPLFGNKGGGFQFDMMQQRIGEFKEIGKIIDWSGK
ncbi:pre-toxin TG domain-containing protein [Listeria grayi]|uniref:pre-toxin TG domain-containing protein n=1 Tax=Listeria grayi TaxID=1641 RepID=UPI00162611BE|nr:pre-toxin TG domain-containing protein [Listeria grayi]MBC1921989.1 hypothetical protein [Listeria grayi]